MKILNFGSCNIDTVFSVSDFVRGGETIPSFHTENHPGGKGLNQSVAAARAGGNVFHAGCIGSDGGFLADFMKSSGVDTTYLDCIGLRTGRAFIQVNSCGENAIVIDKGANALITEEYADRVLDNFSFGDILLLQNEISSIPYIIRRAHEKSMHVVLNPSPFDEELRRIDFSSIDTVILNETEADGFSGGGGIEAFEKWRISSCPHTTAILTLGRRGCIYYTGDTRISTEAYHIECVDSTGAGDTFTGYFLALISNGADAKYALRFASAAAAVTVSRKGAASSIPTASEVEAFLRLYRK